MEYYRDGSGASRNVMLAPVNFFICVCICFVLAKYCFLQIQTEICEDDAAYMSTSLKCSMLLLWLSSFCLNSCLIRWLENYQKNCQKI